jgi:hypothetical protein
LFLSYLLLPIALFFSRILDQNLSDLTRRLANAVFVRRSKACDANAFLQEVALVDAVSQQLQQEWCVSQWSRQDLFRRLSAKPRMDSMGTSSHLAMALPV